jgi:hypothetical protein
MSRRALSRRKIHRRKKSCRRSKRRFSRPNLRKKRQSGVAKRQISAGPHVGREPKGRAPTIAEALFTAQQLLDSGGDGRSKLVAYFETLFDNHPRVYGRLLCRALDEEAAEERREAKIGQ